MASKDATLGPPAIPGLRYKAALGSGGFADVYEYEQLGLGRSVAVKVLHGLTADAGAHFRAEALVMARLSSHPSIVPIYQVGEADGRAYLVMQMCPPPHLGDRIRAGALSVRETLEVGVQLAGAVETAHRLGILHRDIKPANILYTEFGRAALADFGIASSAAMETPIPAFSPAWAPPEQIGAGAATPEVDVFALAATLWAMVTGAPPSRSDHAPALGHDTIPDELEHVLLKSLSPDPAGRYDSALELGRALQQVQQQLGFLVTPIELWEGDDGPTRVTTPVPGDRTRMVELAPTSEFTTRDRLDHSAVAPLTSPGKEPAPPLVVSPMPVMASPVEPTSRGVSRLAAVMAAVVLLVALVGALWLRPWEGGTPTGGETTPASPASTSPTSFSGSSTSPSSSTVSTAPGPAQPTPSAPGADLGTGGWGD